MRAKPEMKPWVNMDTKIRAPQERHFWREYLPLSRVVPPLKGLNKYIDYYSPGLSPWAMQECRPKGLIYVISSPSLKNQLLCYFDVLALAFSLIKCFIIWVRWFVDYV